MDEMAQFAILTVATVLAAAAAMGINWFFLRAAFYLMQPATARAGAGAVKNLRVPRQELVQGTRALARQFVGQRG